MCVQNIIFQKLQNLNCSLELIVPDGSRPTIEGSGPKCDENYHEKTLFDYHVFCLHNTRNRGAGIFPPGQITLARKRREASKKTVTALKRPYYTSPDLAGLQKTMFLFVCYHHFQCLH